MLIITVINLFCLSVDFKKNEKPYKYENSEVYKMLKEVENEPAAPSGDEENRSELIMP